MKKIYLLIAAIIISMLTFGQAQRLVLFEEFTGENCSPCAADNPYVAQLAADYPSEVVLLHYLVPIPSPGILSNQVSAVTQGRMDYYGVNSAPWGQEDGFMWDSSLLADYGNNPITWCANPITGVQNPAYLNAEYATPSPFTISVTDILTGSSDSFYATVTVTAAEAYSGTGPVKLQLAMVENIEFAAPPGNSGETSWGNAVRALYPNYNGTTIVSGWANGHSQSFTFSGQMPSFIRDKTKVRFVAFIQDNTKHVQQTGISPYYTFDIDVAAAGIQGNFSNCPSPQYNPVMNILNAGSSTLTSCTISEYVDNVFADSVLWTGSVAAGNLVQYTLPPLTIATGVHKLMVNLTSPNHATDPNPTNDSISLNIWIPASEVNLPLYEGFENGDPTVNNGWAVESPDHDSTWRVVTPGAGDSSTHSYMVDFYDDLYNYFVNPVNNLYAPPLNLLNAEHTTVKFSFANQWIDFGDGYGLDSLYIDVSADCGNTWATVYQTAAATAPSQSINSFVAFAPTASEWYTDTADISVVANHPNVLLRFRPVFEDGNNFYLDNINIYTNTCAIPLSNNISSVTCPGLADGAATVTPTQGIAPYSYAWSNHDTTSTATGLNAGTYYATVNDAAGCFAIDTIVIQPGVLPNTAVTASGPTTFCAGDSVTLTAVADYTYKWSTGSTTQSITVYQTGNYSVQVTNGNNCSASSSLTSVSLEAATSITTQPLPQVTCAGGTVTFSVSAAGGGLNYQWQFNASNIQGANTSTYTIPEAGTNDTGTYSVTINGTCGNAASNNVSLSLSDTIQISAQPQSQVVCVGQPVSFTCVANANNVSYQWKKVLENIPGATSATYSIDSATPADAATYSCFITSSCGNTTSGVASLTVNSPSAYAYSETICAGSNYAFNGQFLTVSNTYTETLTNLAGCDSVVTLRLTVAPPLTGSITAAICPSQSYSFGGNTLSTPGIYYDTVSTLAGCDSIITLNLTTAPPVTSAIHAAICTGSTYNFNGTIENTPGIYYDTLTTPAGCDSIITLTLDSLIVPTISISNDTLQTQTYATYQWFVNDTLIPNATTQSIVINQNGNYTVAITNGNNCSDTSAVLNVSGLGINNITANGNFKLFPNPNDGSFTLQLTNELPATIEIFDAIGNSIIPALKIQSSQSFNLNTLSAGLYFVHVMQNNQVEVLKFSVVK